MSYGYERMPEHGEIVYGGHVKFQLLDGRLPNEPRAFNVLYLGSTSMPLEAPVLVRLARRRGAAFVWNQNGVAYPAWYGAGLGTGERPRARLLHAADHVFFQSAFCKLAADRFYGERQGPWEMLHNPVDTDRFTPARTRPDRPLDASARAVTSTSVTARRGTRYGRRASSSRSRRAAARHRRDSGFENATVRRTARTRSDGSTSARRGRAHRPVHAGRTRLRCTRRGRHPPAHEVERSLPDVVLEAMAAACPSPTPRAVERPSSSARRQASGFRRPSTGNGTIHRRRPRSPRADRGARARLDDMRAAARARARAFDA